MRPMQDKDALATLDWLVEAGADEAIGETPVNRLVAAPQSAARGSAVSPIAPAQPAPAAPTPPRHVAAG